MPESLLSVSEVLLFGRLVGDLRISGEGEGVEAVAASTGNITNFSGTGPVDGITLGSGNKVLLWEQSNEGENGLYTVGSDSNWTRHELLSKGSRVLVTGGSNQGTYEQMLPWQSNKQRFEKIDSKPGNRFGKNKFLEQQLEDDPRLARIYGFSYEGVYYDLPEPVIFLVHGAGVSATAGNAPTAPAHAARAPLDPSVSGVAAAHFQFSDDINMWSYDKADYTIRMDVMTGMFEQVLLDVCFDGDGPAVAGGRVSGGRVSGGRVSGGRVSGGRVSGGRVSGGRVSGGRVSGSGD